MQSSNRAACQGAASRRPLWTVLDVLRDACLRLVVTGGTVLALVLMVVLLSQTGAEFGAPPSGAAGEPAEPKTSVYAMALTHDQRHLVYLDGAGRVVIRDTVSDRQVDQFELPDGLVLSIACSPTTPRTAFGTAQGDIIVLTIDAAGEAGVCPVRIGGAHAGVITGLAFCPSGRLIASSGHDGIRLWEAQTGERGPVPHSADVAGRCVEFSPAGGLLLAGLADGTLGLWNPETGESCGRLPGHADEVKAVAVSPDGSRACTSGLDGTLCLWDLSSRTLVWKLMADDVYTLTLAFTPDGRLVACGGMPNPRVVFRDARTGTAVVEIGGHRDGVRCLDFTSDGGTLFTGSYDGTVRRWPMPTPTRPAASGLAVTDTAPPVPAVNR